MISGKRCHGGGKGSNIKESIKWAWKGLIYVFISQLNMRIHGITALLVVVASLLLGLSRMELLLILTAIFLVLITETINTAIESTVDLFSPSYHPLAGNAKNLSAGAVLLSAIFSFIVAGFIFAPRLILLIRLWLE